MPIPKQWPWRRRLRAWLTWADFDQAINDKPPWAEVRKRQKLACSCQYSTALNEQMGAIRRGYQPQSSRDLDSAKLEPPSGDMAIMPPGATLLK